MKKILIMLLIIAILLVVVYCIFLRTDNNLGDGPMEKQSSLPTEQFIIDHLLTEEGLIQTNFQNQPMHNVALSESLGLWMEYLALKQDDAQFSQAVEAMKSHFQWHEKLIGWQIVDGKIAEANALIDDLRIMEALFTMGELTGNQSYIQEAKTLGSALYTHNIYEGYFTDFYEKEYGTRSDFITISYLNDRAFGWMEKYGILSAKEREEITSFLRSLPKEEGFYPQTYYVDTNKYVYNDEVNLIDQLYIVLHLERAGIDTSDFYTWLTAIFQQENKLFGRYDATTKDPVVNYESVAVYALAILYTLERDAEDFAESLNQQMHTLQVTDMTSLYYGGYIDEGKQSTHSFDNLLAIIAERNILQKNIIK